MRPSATPRELENHDLYLTRGFFPPFRYPDLWEMYKKAVASFWTTEEVDLTQDLRDWVKLTGEHRSGFCDARAPLCLNYYPFLPLS